MKISAILLCLCLFFSSCSAIDGYGEPEDRYIVSAIGFDQDGETLTVSVQIVDGSEFFVRTGRGESARGAMAHITGADSRRLEISHCALIVIGDGVEGETLADIFEYCRRNKDVTVGVKLSAAHNAEELMRAVDGYELLGAVRDGESGFGFVGGSRFYEIEGERSAGNAYRLPYFENEGETFTLSGLKFFKNDKSLVKLDRSESAYYMMLKGELEGGCVDVSGDSLYLGACRAEYDLDGESLFVLCTLEARSEITDEDKKEMAERAEKLYEQLYLRYGDLFGFGEIKEIRVECRVKER